MGFFDCRSYRYMIEKKTSIPDSLTLHGKVLQKEGLQKYADECSGSSEKWKADLGQFLTSWLTGGEEIIVKTSGSTGEPKLFSIPKTAMIASAEASGTFLNLKAGDTALLCLSASTIAGMMMVVRSMVLKLNLILIPPDGKPCKNIDPEIKTDFAAMVPAQVFNCMSDDKGRAYLSNIQKLIIGGGEISAKLEQQLQDLPNAVYATYGMTETITHVAMRRVNGKNRSEDFKTLPGIEISTDERGCLIIHASRISDKPLITNDLADITGANSFRWLGRADNIINRGGKKLIPEVIENKLANLIEFRFIIAAFPDEKYGQVPVLIVESDTFDANESERLMDLIRQHLPYDEIPVRLIPVRKFAETGNGKINRPATIILLNQT